MQLPIPVAMIKHPDQKKQPKGRKGLFNPQFQVLLHHSEEVKAETQSYHIHYQEKRKKRVSMLAQQSSSSLLFLQSI